MLELIIYYQIRSGSSSSPWQMERKKTQCGGEAEGAGRDEHPASSSPGMDPHPPAAPQLGRSPLGRALWKAPPRSLLMVPRGIWGDEASPQPFPPLSAPLLPLQSRIQLHAPSRNSCSAWIFNANGLAFVSPPFPLPECSDGGQGASACPSSPCHTPCHPLGQGTGRGEQLLSR